MSSRTSNSCSAIALMFVGLSSAPAAACPWNGCGTDASNAARRSAYYAAPYAYVPPSYGYAAQLSAPVYGYASPVYGYAPPVYRKRIRR